jgi:DNA-binding NarL/FixJ family response regulator
MQLPINIVIADDSPIILDGIRFMFSEYQEMIIQETAFDGKQLVAAVAACKPDVVITDIQMPVMNGIEATRIIKERLPAVAVIALTSFGDDSLILDMLDAGASGYLLKSTSREDLVSAIRAVNAGDQYFCKSTSKRLSEMISHRQFPNVKQKENVVLSEKEHGKNKCSK